MKLGLAAHTCPREPAKELEPGVMQLPSRQPRSTISVIDTETGAIVQNVSAFIWGPGKGFAGAIEAPGLFDPEHFEEGKDYVLIAFPCDEMIRFAEAPK